MAHPIIEGLIEGMRLPPDYSVSEWADANLMLSPELAAEPGPWRTDRAPYQREILDSLADPAIDVLVFKSSAQVGKTSILTAGIGYYIDHAPSPMLAVQPTLDMAAAFSKDKLDPVIRDTPCLARRVSPEKARSGGNTMYYKGFPGGQLSIAGANSPTSLRMRSVKLVWADEVDAYPKSAGREGSPVKLAYKRTQTFRENGALLFLSSTPTVKGISEVDEWYEQSDQRHYLVPCAHCHTHQKLVFENIVWEKGDPDSAMYSCEECGVLNTDIEIKRGVKQGYWQADKAFNGIAGFYIWQIHSPWSSLASIVREYEDAEGKPGDMQVFHNTVLGLSWDDAENAPADVETLLNRREIIDPDVLHENAAYVAASVDVQGDRLELLVVAYGPNMERWTLSMEKHYCNPRSEAAWQWLENQLSTRRYMHPTGNKLRIEVAGIDSGYCTQEVYAFCTKWQALGRPWFAVKGVAGEGRPAFELSKTRAKGGGKLFAIGVDDCKTHLYACLAMMEPGPGYVHIADRPEFGREWLTQLTCERVHVTHDNKGYVKREWHCPPGARNEAIDLMVYNYAVVRGTNVDIGARLASFYEERGSSGFEGVASMFMGQQNEQPKAPAPTPYF